MTDLEITLLAQYANKCGDWLVDCGVAINVFAVQFLVLKLRMHCIAAPCVPPYSKQKAVMVTMSKEAHAPYSIS